MHTRDLWQGPIAWCSGPAAWMPLTSLLLGLLQGGAERTRFAIVALIGVRC